MVSTSSLELSVRFLVPRRIIFEALTDTNAAQYYTQSVCKIVPQAEGEYSLYNNSIQGRFITCSPEKIVLEWRRREWEEGLFSTVTMTLTEMEPAVTEIHLEQSGIPKCDRYNNVGVEESVRQGWIDMIFRKIGMMLGYTFQTEDEFEYVCLLEVN